MKQCWFLWLSQDEEGKGRGKEEVKTGNRTTTVDLNVALIKMTCTQIDKFFFLSVFVLLVLPLMMNRSILVLPCCIFYCLSSSIFFCFLHVSNFTPSLFSFLLPTVFFLSEEAQCLDVKVVEWGRGSAASKKVQIKKKYFVTAWNCIYITTSNCVFNFLLFY